MENNGGDLSEWFADFYWSAFEKILPTVEIGRAR